MHWLRHLVFIALFGSVALAARAQYAAPPSDLATDLCTCMGSIDAGASDHEFDLAVRNCLNTVFDRHSHEVLWLLQRYPDQGRKMYLLGQLLGGELDRTCGQYPLVKDRLRLLLVPGPAAPPST